MKLYISGPMKGYAESNYPAFLAADVQLEKAGHTPVNPVDNGVPAGQPWATYLRADIIMLMECDGVAVLPAWEMSSGALLEVTVARALGMPVMPLEKWIELAP